jgi:hypothetical protein
MTEYEKTDRNFLGGPKYRLRIPFIEPAHPNEAAFSWFAYDIARYFFELCRNIIVIGAIRYAADKTGSVWLSVLFYLSTPVFVLFVYSFLCSWDLKIFSHLFRKSAVGKLLDILLTILLSLVVTNFIFGAISQVADKLN